MSSKSSPSLSLQRMSLPCGYDRGERYSRFRSRRCLRFTPTKSDKRLQTFSYLCPHLVLLEPKRSSIPCEAARDATRPPIPFPMPLKLSGSGSRLPKTMSNCKHLLALPSPRVVKKLVRPICSKSTCRPSKQTITNRTRDVD